MLKIEKIPQFLSPTALITAENMPNTFYLNRLIDDRMPKEPQILAAAVGSAFDYLVKSELILTRFSGKKHLLNELRGGIETNQDEAFTAGKIALNAYTRVIDMDIFHDIEIHKQIEIDGIPITGKLDASISNPQILLNKLPFSFPFDWKVMGYTSISKVSPPPFYKRIWKGIRPLPCHKEYHKDIPFDSINDKWALQLCTYGWMLGIPIFTEFPAYIDVILFHNKIIQSIAIYSGIVTKKYQELTLSRYKNLWNSIMNGSFIKRLASSYHEDLVWIASKEEEWFRDSQYEIGLY
jgi:hypothetical protein